METAKLFFRENPFSATPSPDRYLAIGSVESARVRLMDAIDRREGPGLIVGPPGTGKSLLCSLIANAYQNRFDVVLLSETRICTRKALLQHLLHHLGLPYVDRSEGELRLSLIDRATTGGPDGQSGLMIIVDEAQTLPGRLLEELRMMSGIVRNGSPRVQLVLAGGPSLDERLAQPRMEAFSQRIGARCYLHPLGQNETANYVLDSIRRAGADPSQAIDDSAIESIYYASSGIPRLINQTMSRAVAIAETDGRSRITGEFVEHAWADLQQLPSPSNWSTNQQRKKDAEFASSESAQDETPASVVEFGFLDDSDESDDEVPVSATKNRIWQSDPMAETADFDDEVNDADQDFADQDFADQDFADQDFADQDFNAHEFNELELGPETNNDLGEVEHEISQLEESNDGEIDEEVEEHSEVEVQEIQNFQGLFGDDFDEEQIISFNTAASAWAAPSSLFDKGFNDAPFDVQVERDLHDEIVAINKGAIGSYHPTEIETIDDSEEVLVDDSESIPFGDGHDENECMDIVIRDDSDMLVIEDDVEVESVPESLQPRGPRDVDMTSENEQFKALFAHLREG